ncbi:MAG: FtsQ-type POTRA domain-containing protein [Candidatus Zixiibacteriota bacterium]|nr:MAG: FtsQ-type POTRA domain-containing protein [candidate division Zixibacteria bacterium]
MAVSTLKRRIILLAATVALTSLVVVIHVTDFCDLEAVTIDGQASHDWQNEYDLAAGKPIFHQSVDGLAERLLQKSSVVRVDVDYRLPHTVEVKINEFTPACFVVDAKTGRLKGISSQGRVVPLSGDNIDWDNPVFTSITAARWFDFCDDPRARLIVPQLLQLRDDNVDLYRLIGEVDFGSPDFLIVSISGLPYRLIVDAMNFSEQLSAFGDFIEPYQVNLEGTRMLDMRHDRMIVQIDKK